MKPRNFGSKASFIGAVLLILLAYILLPVPNRAEISRAWNDILKDQRLRWIKTTTATNTLPLVELSWICRSRYDGKFLTSTRGIVHPGEPFWFEIQTGDNVAHFGGVIRANGNSTNEFVFVGSYGEGTNGMSWDVGEPGAILIPDHGFTEGAIPGIQDWTMTLSRHGK